MLVASVSLPPEALALEHTAQTVPDIEIEAERIAAHSTKWVMPCLWVSHSEFDAVTEAFRSDSSIEQIVDGARFDEEAFYQVEWAEEVQRRIDGYTEKEGSILEAEFSEREWQLKLRFATRDQFDAFRENVIDAGHTFRLTQLYEPEIPHQRYDNLTPAQRDALVTAVEHGYFRVPRETTTDALADKLDISHQALSELLRRGTENLVLSTLTVEDNSRDQ
ncbi:helix-turn-helix domain-containing protein [Natrarchaeobius oligotrophus]|uniref:Bacterio-opsin activator n=1 Tax=Natrarchaeobius chitinivorans TaxID=1679083 RepID=A0A3N6NH77_NATCH|nr:helix-turn-helix domain-containing protein [Natrarchaeobius chitinivorans]RQG98422.1 bacterio-opsin activator [Natrarchaeobius chitinivorans]